ncbi:MAG: hypothetical protein HXY30_20490 [Pseudorhodoplanes sp.]|nr:hypothetical protein [Pseudorhodoplanes sp.]
MTAPRHPYLPDIRQLRALLGLVVAYAVALQFVLAALVAAQHAAAAASGETAPFTICASSGAEPAGDAIPPAHLASACALCTLALSASNDAPQVAAIPVLYRLPSARSGTAFRLPSFHHQGTKSSQGPPASA